jgi:hypothetical protein
MGLILISLKISLSKPKIISNMTKSAIQIHLHVAIRVFVSALPRCKLSQNIGAGGDGFRHSLEKGRNKG